MNVPVGANDAGLRILLIVIITGTLDAIVVAGRDILILGIEYVQPSAELDGDVIAHVELLDGTTLIGNPIINILDAYIIDFCLILNVYVVIS